MNYNTKECGKRIRQLRLKSRLTQEQIANAVNVDQSFYGRIESGKKGCSVDLFIQLSVLFGVSLDYLILGRYLGEHPERTDVVQLKADIEDLVDRLEKFKQCV